ncbi:MAG: diguanylate cyclase [Sterolibacteriaceae bacterium MAG5]|nr:diguanylate cyclase [Candidatus Nitricoxidireducens bremensis]
MPVLLQTMIARLQAGRLADLLSARGHAPYLTRHRLEAVVSRIRLVALTFSVLTLLWIPLDMATLPRAQWIPLALCRLAAVAAFLGLALMKERERSRSRVLGLLAATLAIPLTLFCVAQWALAGMPLSGLAAINASLYEALPFIVLAGLAIFPLVAAEGLLFALPILAVATAVQLAAAGLDLVRLFSTLWVLGLALGVYLLACAIQLHYMMALLHRASRDPLTGALTRRSGVEVVDLHFRLACEQNAPLAIAFIDVDNFKSINDSCGHEAGDQALREAAAALTQLLRLADAVIRWGGEEFVLLLPNTGMDGVRIVCGRIVEQWFGARPDGGTLTASIGVAERIGDQAGDWSQLVKLADERMYAAKKAGKACCVLGGGTVIRASAAETPAG